MLLLPSKIRLIYKLTNLYNIVTYLTIFTKKTRSFVCILTIDTIFVNNRNNEFNNLFLLYLYTE